MLHMTDTRIARAFPDLSEPESLVALLGETLDLARGMKLSRQEIIGAEGKPEQIAELLSQTGLLDEIAAAEQTATATVVELLARISEADLEQGRDKGLLSPEDFREALAAKRTLLLKRARTQEFEHGQEQ